jgi:polyphenol oxidase
MAHGRALRDHIHADAARALVTEADMSEDDRNAAPSRTYPLRATAWVDVPGLVHGFLGRTHGLPPGPFTLAEIGDALRRAGESPRLVAAARQVHGPDVLAPEDLTAILHEPGCSSEDLPAGDALVSASADVLLTIRTADCVPVLLVAPRARAVAAVHAGWRGTLAGVLEAGVEALCSRYGASPGEIVAAIGPAIGGCCYEFGVEHRDAFVSRFGAAAAKAWLPSAEPERWRLDLRFVCGLALEQRGVPRSAIDQVGPCTADHPDELHSYRRDGAHAGRQLSYIGWTS